jgi:hypothetical protein
MIQAWEELIEGIIGEVWDFDEEWAVIDQLVDQCFVVKPFPRSLARPSDIDSVHFNRRAPLEMPMPCLGTGQRVFSVLILAEMSYKHVLTILRKPKCL